MEPITQVIILLTPFHKKAIYHLFPEIFNTNSTLLLHATIVDVSEFSCKKEVLTQYHFSRKKIFKSPFKFLLPFKEKVNGIKNEIEVIGEKYHFVSGVCFYIGSDKDIFTQMLLDKLKKSIKSVSAVDEGLGFYVRRSFKDYLIACVYKMVTPILFGQRLYYIKRLGTLPRVNTVYLRDKRLLPKKERHISYIEFNFKATKASKRISKGKILLYSFPEQDYLFDVSKKINLYTELGDYLLQNNRKLVIKPHPREEIHSLTLAFKNKENVEVLDGSRLGETLDYFEYEYIINVFSSVILDIIGNAYPKERLITMGFTPKPLIHFDEKLRYIPIKEFNAQNHIKFEN